MGLLAIPFFLLVSLGVYLGLIVRLNSWDLLSRPRYVADIALDAFTRPLLLKAIFVLAAFLWVLYVTVDIWLDGFQARFLKSSNSAGHPLPGAE